MSFIQLAVPGSQQSHHEEKHPSAKSPDRQPFSWYASFAEPYPLPDVAPSERNKQSDRQISEKLLALNKELAREQRRSSALHEEVKLWCHSDLHRGAKVDGSINNQLRKPLNELIFTPRVESQVSAARSAVEHSACLTRMGQIREEIQELNARTDRE